MASEPPSSPGVSATYEKVVQRALGDTESYNQKTSGFVLHEGIGLLSRAETQTFKQF